MRVYTVCLEKMEFVGFHGCREDEKVDGNVFRVDFEASYRSSCAKDDSLDETVDYGKVYERIADAMRSRRCNLLETLVSIIIDGIRKDFPEFFSIKVKVSKKNPPVAGPCGWSSVSETWERND